MTGFRIPNSEFRVSDHRRSAQSGQAMVESIIIMLITLLLLFGLLQIAHAYAGREILRHSAARAARAKTVGFNRWMCEKVMRVAAIPTSGSMLEPQIEVPDSALSSALASKRDGELWDWSIEAVPRSERGALEAARIPEYLASENDARAEYILNYEGWDTLHASGLGGYGSTPLSDDNTLTVSVKQDYPLTIFIRVLNDWVGYIDGGKDGKESLTLRGEHTIESHYPLYLEDQYY